VQARPENRGADQQLAFEGRLRPIVGSQPLMLTAASRSPAQRTDRERSIADIARASSPAVVLIETFDGSNKPVAQGSGFVISPDGRIATNHHVIEGADSAIVKWACYRRARAMPSSTSTSSWAVMISPPYPTTS
jgi:S1-C subfamily serine protease